MFVKYCGPALDYSGYGEANRHDIGALTAAGVTVIGEYTRHCLEIADFGELGQLARDCTQNTGDYRVKILHTTPNLYGRFIEPGKYHIGRVFWETDQLPPDFAAGCRMVQEIWTGSEFNAAAIRKAGVTDVPIYIIPEAIKTPAPNPEPFLIPNKADFKFYSIFEWTERKNPIALLESFWREFEGVKGVSLTLKSYADNFTPEKRVEIKRRFADVKRSLNLADYAPVYVYSHLMDRAAVYRFHSTFDCFVSAHRGEGWGIPQMEAMLMGKLVISTGCGGIHEHIADVSKLVDYKLVPVSNVDRNGQWYRPEQNWAEIDVEMLRTIMRWAYEHQDDAAKYGEMAAKAVVERFSLEVVGKEMLNRLNQLTTILQ